MAGYDPTLDPAGDNPLVPRPSLIGDPTQPVPSGSEPTQLLAGATASETLNVPRHIGPYRIIKMIGEGGMGAVYEAEQDKPRRSVALKIIRPGYVSKQMLRRFEHESEILGRLQHPGIAQIYEAGTEDAGYGAQPYFAMELIRGRPLIAFITVKKLSINERLELLIRICDAVQYAHQQGVIHRDLKPGNILVDDTGQPKILDFGVARATDSDIHATMATATGQIIGTLPYMSPEQAGGEVNEMDTRSDVYALGVIAYELLSGRLPYSLQDQVLIEAVRIIQQDEPSRLGTIDGSLGGDIETIVGKALEKEKSRRYATASDLAADVRRFLNYEPISARAPSTLYQLRKFARRNKLLVGGVLLLIVVLTGGLAATTWQAQKAMRQQAIAERRSADMQAMARRFMYQFHDAIENLPGSTKAREMLVSTSLEFLEKLRADAGSDTNLLGDVATAYLKVGDIQGNPSNANLGRLEEAKQSYAIAVELAERRRKLLPNDPEANRSLAKTYDAVGDVMVASGDLKGGLERYQAGLAITRSLADQRPRDVTAREDLWSSHDRIGRTLQSMGKRDEALVELRAALATAEKASADFPGNSATLRGISVGHERIAMLLAEKGDIAAALDEYRADRALRRKRAESEPNNVEAQRDLAVVLSQLGKMHTAANDPAAALEAIRESIEISRKLSNIDPANAQAKRDLSVYLYDLGMLQAGQNDAAAVATFSEGVENMSRLYESDVKNVQTERDLMITLNTLVAAMVQFNQSRAAIPHARRAVDLAQDLAKKSPEQADRQNDLAIAYTRLGGAFVGADDADGALSAYASSLEVTKGLHERHPEEPRYTRSLAISFYQLAGLHEMIVSVPELRDRRHASLISAKQYYGESLKLFEGLAKINQLPHGFAEIPDEAKARIKACDDLLAAPASNPATQPTTVASTQPT